MRSKRSRKRSRAWAAKDRDFRNSERKRAAPQARPPPAHGISELPPLLNGDGPIHKRGQHAEGG